MGVGPVNLRRGADRGILLRIRRPRTTAGPMHVLLVCSGGGHLAQLMVLRPWWEAHDRTWVSFSSAEVRSQLADERIVLGHEPTTRNIPNLLRNIVLSIGVLRNVRPDLIVSNGAGLAVPFFWVGWLMGIPSIFLEVYDRIDSTTMTGRMVRPVASACCVQWPEQSDLYPATTMIGPLWE